MKLGDLYAPRKAFGEALVELGSVEERLVVLDADVGTSTQTSLFRDAFPDRYYQIGIAEQNMISMAAGRDRPPTSRIVIAMAAKTIHRMFRRLRSFFSFGEMVLADIGLSFFISIG